jgi:hypothetical protein
MRFNDPAQIKAPKDFQRAAQDIGYTFNWFYTDSKHIAYFNSGANPRRPKGSTTTSRSRRQKFEWRGFTPPSQHPQVVDQKYLVSWNNKQAKGFRGSDSNTYSSVYRSQLLEDRLKPLIKGKRKTTLAEMVNAMELAGVTDLRAHADLALALKVIGRPADPACAARPTSCARGSARAACARTPTATASTSTATRSADGRVVAAVGARAVPPRARRQGVPRADGRVELDNAPNNHGQHLGSAYQTGWYGFVRKDLRTVLGARSGALLAQVLRRREAQQCRRRCGARSPPRRRRARRPLQGRLGLRGREEGERPVVLRRGPPAPVGGATQPLIHWINRPTYQQVTEVQEPGAALCGSSLSAISTDPYELSRFVDAQERVYDDAVSELRAGRKTSHWMWFVFPQIAGSAAARPRSGTRSPRSARPRRTSPTRCWGAPARVRPRAHRAGGPQRRAGVRRARRAEAALLDDALRPRRAGRAAVPRGARAVLRRRGGSRHTWSGCELVHAHPPARRRRCRAPRTGSASAGRPAWRGPRSARSRPA